MTMDLSASGGLRDPRNMIVGGSSKNPGKSPGYADLLYWTSDAVYLWDAKVAGGPAEVKGGKEVRDKVKALQAQLKAAGDNRTVKVGFSFPIFIGSNRTKPNENVITRPSVISPGVIAYSTTELRRTPPPAPIPIPQEQPHEKKEPWWKSTTARWIGAGALTVAAAGLVVATIAEDVGTGGVGILDDPASFAAAGAMLGTAGAMV